MSRRSWARDLIDLALPAGCVSCGAWVPAGASLVCPRCRTRLRAASWPRCPRCHHPRGSRRAEGPDCLHCRAWPEALTRARYAYVLEGVAAELVHALKYEGWRELAPVLGEALAGCAPGRSARPGSAGPIVVPVPTTPRRLRARGYNQAAVIAEALAPVVGGRLRSALVRVRGGGSQTSLAPDERRRNVRGVFAAAPGGGAAVAGRSVLLVDDVLTTGATAGEAAETLTGMGAQTVTLLAFARALPTLPRRAA